MDEDIEPGVPGTVAAGPGTRQSDGVQERTRIRPISTRDKTDQENLTHDDTLHALINK